jgi:hypothetical protein
MVCGSVFFAEDCTPLVRFCKAVVAAEDCVVKHLRHERGALAGHTVRLLSSGHDLHDAGKQGLLCKQLASQLAGGGTRALLGQGLQTAQSLSELLILTLFA